MYLMLKRFLLFLVSLLLSQKCLGGIVEETCKRAASNYPSINYSFCVSSLQADPRSRGADLAGLGLITLDLCSGQAKNTASHVANLLKNPGLNPADQMCLHDCSELYSDALDTLKQCEDAFKNKRYSDLNVWISAVMEDSDTCESGFKEENRPSPLSKENNDLAQLGSIALATINFLSH